jgi:hypothetical protein
MTSSGLGVYGYEIPIQTGDGTPTGSHTVRRPLRIEESTENCQDCGDTTV